MLRRMKFAHKVALMPALAGAGFLAITDRVLDGLAEWQSRPLDAVYPVIFVDAIHVKIRDGKVAIRIAQAADMANRDAFRLGTGSLEQVQLTQGGVPGNGISARASPHRPQRAASQ